jgi:hypothetical protein
MLSLRYHRTPALVLVERALRKIGCPFHHRYQRPVHSIEAYHEFLLCDLAVVVGVEFDQELLDLFVCDSGVSEALVKLVWTELTCA